MALDQGLLRLLACPADKQPLFYIEDEDTLYNPRLRLRYKIRNDIAILLNDEAESADDQEHDRLSARISGENIAATGPR